MSLSHSVVKQLRRELADLNRKRGALDASICALESVLGYENGKSATKEGKSATKELDASVNSTRSNKRSGTPRVKSKRRTLRHVVSSVIRRAPGLTPRGITQTLERAGFSVRGKTGLHERVQHELRRLRQKGLMKRDANGGYQVIEAQSVQADGPESEAVAVAL